ncbi:maf-like family protein, partial [Vibrio parahaemolyticus V-223/04]
SSGSSAALSRKQSNLLLY